MNSSSNLLLPALLIAVGIAVGGLLIGKSHVNAKRYDRFVTVKGLAEREVQANVAIWPLTITAASNDLATLKIKLDSDAIKLETFLRTNGFNEDELSKGFPNIQDTRAQSYGGVQNPFRYVARMDFTIRTEYPNRLRNTMDAMPSLIAEGVVLESKNQWQPIQYLFTNLNEIKPDMIEEATKNAREVADKFAADSGSRVGKIKVARQGVFSISDRDINTGYIKNIRVVTTIDYLLQD